jgi:hypothetical protein
MRPTTKSCLGIVSAVGVVGTHLIAYFFGEPTLGVESRLLFATAHNHWNYVLAVAVAFLVYGLASFVWSRYSNQTAATPRQVVLWAFPRLSLLQLVGFLLLEWLEIGIAGGDSHHLLTNGPILIGLFVGVLVAAFASFVLGLIALTVDLVATRRQMRANEQNSSTVKARGPMDYSQSAEHSACGLRGPPLTGIG